MIFLYFKRCQKNIPAFGPPSSLRQGTEERYKSSQLWPEKQIKLI